MQRLPQGDPCDEHKEDDEHAYAPPDQLFPSAASAALAALDRSEGTHGA
jgi:hypothetical protein